MKILTLFSFLLLISCLQGPWDYTPTIEEQFWGITVNAYVVAGKPVEKVCFEPVVGLQETLTRTVRFYETASVSISGESVDGNQSINLTPSLKNVNCFEGPVSYLPLAGKEYQLRAVFDWDSAGIRVSSEIAGKTTIPALWSIGDTAMVNSMALSAQTLNSPEQGGEAGGLAAAFNGLPEEVQTDLATIWGEKFLILSQDSLAMEAFIRDSMMLVSQDVDSLLELYTKKVPYLRGDTVAYLTGALNTKSHYFDATHSDDVAGVLITQSIEENAILPETRFDEIIKNFTDLEVYMLHNEDLTRRLIFYQHFNSDEYNLFDSIPVVNSWLVGGRNVFYFYGFDVNYKDFVETYINEANNPKVKRKHSVTGAQGYFAGAVVDSFEVFGVIPQNILSYNRIETRAAYCNSAYDNAPGVAGDPSWLKWYKRTECWQWAPDYCEMVGYREIDYQNAHPEIFKERELHNSCVSEAVVKALKEGLSSTHYVQEFSLEGANFQPLDAQGNAAGELISLSASGVQADITHGKRWYCIQSGFQEDFCSEFKVECYEENKAYCKDLLMDFCEVNYWNAPGCEEARQEKCSEPDVFSNVLCKGTN